MKSTFSPEWKASIQPRRQRKYRAKAPLHLRQKFLCAPLAKEPAKREGIASATIRKGDKVQVMAGEFKKKSGTVERVDRKGIRIYVIGIEVTKRDGTKALRPIHPSNVMITETTGGKKKAPRKGAAQRTAKESTP